MSAHSILGTSAAELALRLSALRGTTVYMAYLAAPAEIEAALEDLAGELAALDPSAQIATLRSRAGEPLVADLATITDELVLVDTRSFTASDWALLDRRRSSLAHAGVLIFMTTPSSFDELMRSAPNLSSWLGAQVCRPAMTPDPERASRPEVGYRAGAPRRSNCEQL